MLPKGDFCGCCGRPAVGDWCLECRAHLLSALGRAPWDRTYYAQHGTDCPFTEKPIGEGDSRPPEGT